jgi:PadR family transcriptional regulator, regulatory protein PadR
MKSKSQNKIYYQILPTCVSIVTSRLDVASSRFEVTLSSMDAPVTAKAALLQALISGPGFGLDLIDRVKKKTNGQLELGQGSVYPALRDLEREGLARSWDGDPLPERGGRPRRYYELTAEGRRVALGQGEVVMGLFGQLLEGTS